jgi:hypothetical protein
MRLTKAAARAVRTKARHDLAAYIYPDGILVRETVRGTLRGKPVERGIWHQVPGKIPIVTTSYKTPDKVARIVVHEPTVLLDGVSRVEVYFNNASEALRERGMSCDTLTLVTDNGARHRTDIFSFLASDFTVQRDDAVTCIPSFAETVADLEQKGDLA